MPVCIVKGCVNSDVEKSATENSKTDQYFCLPTNQSYKRKWEHFSGRKFKDKFPPHALFCSRHFTKDNFVLVEDKWKLMPHAIPVMNAPEGIKTFAYPVAVKTNWKGRKTRGRSYFNKAEEYPGITPEQRAEYIERITRDIGPPFQRRFEDCPKIIPTAHKQPITFDRVLEVFRKQASSPWSYLDTENKFYFFRSVKPPFCLENDESNDDDPAATPLMPTIIDCVTIFKKKAGRMVMTTMGRRVNIQNFSPDDFDPETETLIPKVMHVSNFINLLKKQRSGNEIRMSDTISMAATSMQTSGQACLDKPERLNNIEELGSQMGSALKFLGNQLALWAERCNRWPSTQTNAMHGSFVPSAVRVALLMRAQSKTAYSILKDCDQLVMPPNSFLDNFQMIRAPQGITSARIASLRALSERLNPIDKYVSLIIDDMALEQVLQFNNEGQVIGHAVNDTVMNFEKKGEPVAATPKDAFANRIFCYMAQGLSQNFHQVVATYPVMNPSIEFLKKCLLDTLGILHQTGFQVLITIAASNTSNRKVYKMISKKSDDNLENDPVIKHPCDPNGSLILSYDPIHLMQMIRNDFFRKEEFSSPKTKADGKGAISWVLLSQIKDHESKLPKERQRAKVLQGLAGQILKSYRQDCRIDMIVHLFSAQVRNALNFYKGKNAKLWPVIDTEETAKFVENVRRFFEVLNINGPENGPIQRTTDAKVTAMAEVAKYFRNEALPIGALIKSTAVGVVQTCVATIKLVNILINQIGITPIYTARLQKRALWSHMVEHKLHSNRAKLGSGSGDGMLPRAMRPPRPKSKKICDDVLPPKKIEEKKKRPTGAAAAEKTSPRKRKAATSPKKGRPQRKKKKGAQVVVQHKQEEHYQEQPQHHIVATSAAPSYQIHVQDQSATMQQMIYPTTQNDTKIIVVDKIPQGQHVVQLTSDQVQQLQLQNAIQTIIP